MNRLQQTHHQQQQQQAYRMADSEGASVEDFSPARHSSIDVDLASRRSSAGGAPVLLYTPPVCRTDIQEFRGVNAWSTGCCMAPCHQPFYCLSAQLCLPWRLYEQRKFLLQKRGDDYMCCAGICGKQYTDPCALYVRGNDDICLGLEVVFCPCWATMGNRWMVQQHYNLKNDWIDSCANAFTLPFSILSYFWQDDICDNLVYLPYPLCGGWLLTQQKVHMEMLGYPIGHNIVKRELPQEMR